MGTIIKLKCTDQVLSVESKPTVASGGVLVTHINVSFCSKWDGMAKTAVFWRKDKGPYHVLLDENDSCAIPKEILSEAGVFFFGVFGVDESGRQRTTTVSKYIVTSGVITEDAKPSDPTPDVYAQILAYYRESVSFDAFIGDNGNWFIRGEDTEVPATGPQGAPGNDGYTPLKGVDYFDGDNGLTPFIGDNGNWWIGDTDTGVCASGGVFGGGGGDGVGIVDIKRTDGNGSAGTADTYTIYLSDGSEKTFTVYNGKDGADGYTPVKGNDYFTESDKAEMVTAVINALTTAEGGSF